MENMSIMQILKLWCELEDAYNGRNRYGGNVAEIYAYTLHGHNPTANYDPMESAMQVMEEAAESLRSVCAEFQWLRRAIIEVECKDGWIPIEQLKTTVHREHVRVTPK